MSADVYAHFIGVGGAGMSGIALVLHQRGVAITGSDLKESRYSRALKREGVPVVTGHDARNLGDPQVVVASTAIPASNPEIVEARARGLEIWPRARMLAELAGERKTVAVAGTHGKTSTSSMVATMLSRMDLDPTFLIGGEVDGFDTNACNGSGEHFVVEADESDGSFVYLDPFVSVITNIEADHMDHYDSLAQIEDTFKEFVCRTHPAGSVIVCGDDARAEALVRECERPVLTYGFAETCDVRCTINHQEGLGHAFTVALPDGTSASCHTCVPGAHMVSNATAALACAYALGLDVEAATHALATFSGVRRRFDLVAQVEGVTIVDDYAHHPTEIAATVGAAKDLGYRRVWALFQPHRYSRTQAFAAEFGDALGAADNVVLLDVYSAGEPPIPGVSGRTLLESLLRVHPRAQAAYLPHRTDIVPFIASRVHEGDLVMTLGAGDVTSIGPQIAAELASRGAGASS